MCSAVLPSGTSLSSASIQNPSVHQGTGLSVQFFSAARFKKASTDILSVFTRMDLRKGRWQAATKSSILSSEGRIAAISSRNSWGRYTLECNVLSLRAIKWRGVYRIRLKNAAWRLRFCLSKALRSWNGRSPLFPLILTLWVEVERLPTFSNRLKLFVFRCGESDPATN